MKKSEVIGLVNSFIEKSGGTTRLKYSRVGGSFFFFEPVGKRGVTSRAYPDTATVQELCEEWKVAEVVEAINPRDDC